MSDRMSDSAWRGYTMGLRLAGSTTYPLVIDVSTDLNKEEFILGLRMGGFYGEVYFNG